MKIIFHTGCAVAFLLTTIGFSVAEDKDAPAADVEENIEENKEKGPSVWMRTKLKHSQNILAGLATGDFEMIGDSAKRMNSLLYLERLARGNNEECQIQLRFFRHATDALIQHASTQNLDGATLAFMQLANSCVECHRTIRDEDSAATGPVVFDHVVTEDTKYYIGGPQQAKPADGSLQKGTRVSLLGEASSYSLVNAENGVVAYVATASLRSLGATAKEEWPSARCVCDTPQRFHGASRREAAVPISSGQTGDRPQLCRALLASEPEAR